VEDLVNHHIRVRASALIIKEDAILLVEFEDENGLHYNLPGGGAEQNETLIEAVKREAMEEASVDVDVGPIAFVYEYVPQLCSYKFGETHTLSVIFDCKLQAGSKARMPGNPDFNQKDVKWIKLSELDNILLYPEINKYIIEYVKSRKTIEIIEEHSR
jgi:8-oxo-dGTP diphosphatase